MSKRSERREAERTARKLAYQLSKQKTQQITPAAVAVEALVAEAIVPDQSVAPSIDEAIDNAITAAPTAPQDLLARAQAFFKNPTISEAQLTANRANAQLSSGPRTTEGKAKSSANSLKHGLTSKAVVLPGEDHAEYDRQLASYIERLQPANDEELRLVQSQLDCNWRIERMLRMEAAIFFKGSLECKGQFEDRTPLERESLILAEIYLKYEKSLRNLHVQEARLRRCHEKDRAELTRLQTIRKEEEQTAALNAALAAVESSARSKSDGFDFETPSPAAKSPSIKPAANEQVLRHAAR